jgi:Protein of unknown function (DUF2721)
MPGKCQERDFNGCRSSPIRETEIRADNSRSEWFVCSPVYFLPLFANRRVLNVVDTPTATQLSQVISQVTAPAFLLGAVAAFISLLIARLNRVIDRLRTSANADGNDSAQKYAKRDIPLLRRRAILLNRSIFYSTVCAITTTVLVIIAFVTAYLGFQHEYGIALLFVVALAFFAAALVELARETRIALHEVDNVG